MSSKRQEITSVGEDVEKRKPLCTVGGNVNSCSPRENSTEREKEGEEERERGEREGIEAYSDRKSICLGARDLKECLYGGMGGQKGGRA